MVSLIKKCLEANLLEKDISTKKNYDSFPEIFCAGILKNAVFVKKKLSGKTSNVS